MQDPLYSDITEALEGKEQKTDSIIRALKFYCLKENVLDRIQKHLQIAILYLVCIPKSLAKQLFEHTHKHSTVATEASVKRNIQK